MTVDERDTSPPAPVPGAAADLSLAFQEVVRRRPDDVALVGVDRRLTYEALQFAVERTAAAFVGLGVKPGDRLTMAAGVRPEVVIAFLASQHVGAVWVGLNPALSASELALQIEDCEPRIVIADAGCFEKLTASSGEAIRPARIALDGDGPMGWRALVAATESRPTPARAAIDLNAPAAIAYTSGTTGLPKGVVHSQHNILAAVLSRRDGVQALEGEADIRRGVAMGLTNLNAMVRSALTALLTGGAVVCIPRRDALGIAEWIEREQVQAISLPGAILYDLLESDLPQETLSSLRLVGNAGSPIPTAVKTRYEARFGHPVLMAYGQTEALTVLSSSGLNQLLSEGSSGFACGHIEVAILDADGKTARAGAVGEICARARQTGPWADVWRPMLGYWRGRSPEPALADGWLHTGDLGRLGEDGQLFVTGRLKDLIVRGGANVHAAEVERVIAADPRVRAVAVIGLADARLGETVAAVVELAGGTAMTKALAAELKRRAADNLARYKTPETWAFAHSLPRTANGKIIKSGLAAAYFSNTTQDGLVCAVGEGR